MNIGNLVHYSYMSCFHWHQPCLGVGNGANVCNVGFVFRVKDPTSKFLGLDRVMNRA